MTTSMSTSAPATPAPCRSRCRRLGPRSTRCRRPTWRPLGAARSRRARTRAATGRPEVPPGFTGILFAGSARPLRKMLYISDMPEATTASAPDTTTLDEIVDNFSLLDEWDDRYRYVIELGRGLEPLSEPDRTDANKVQGCASQVWLATTVHPDGRGGPMLTFSGDSDAHIVRGLIAILFAMFSGKHASEILSADAIALFERLGLREHLTPQRSNGFRSMVERIRSDARAALAG